MRHRIFFLWRPFICVAKPEKFPPVKINFDGFGVYQELVDEIEMTNFWVTFQRLTSTILGKCGTTNPSLVR